MIPPEFTDSLLQLSYQRSLSGFEQSLKKVMENMDLSAWACLFPPSFNAGGHYLVVGRGIRQTSPALNQQILQELAQSGPNPKREALLQQLGREMAPSPRVEKRIITVTRTKDSLFVFFLYRRKKDFSKKDLKIAEDVGRHLDRCFVMLAQGQEQEFLVDFFRLASNLFSEGLCLLDTAKQLIFENTCFREHLHLWEHGREPTKGLPLSKKTILPIDWKKACDEAVTIFQGSSFPPVSARVAISQGPLVRLELPLTRSDLIEGQVRYLALKSSLGIRPYLLLTSNLHRRLFRNTVAFSKLAKKAAFSKREKEVGALVTEGFSVARISELMDLTLPTVKSHIRAILQKAGVRNRMEFISLCTNK